MTAPGRPPAPLPPMPPRDRLEAWLRCGPLGHLYGGLLDWAQLFSGYTWARLRGRQFFD